MKQKKYKDTKVFFNYLAAPGYLSLSKHLAGLELGTFWFW